MPGSRATSSVLELAERVLDPEVRDDEVLLVHERTDARVDLEQPAADPLHALVVVQVEVADHLARELHEVRPVDGLERHREAGEELLARARLVEDHLSLVGEEVDGDLGRVDVLHQHELGERLVAGEEVDEVVERHVAVDRLLVEQVVDAIDVRGEDAEAARALGYRRLEAHGHVRVAELAGAGDELLEARRPEQLGLRDRDLAAGRVHDRLVAGDLDAAHAVGEHARAERLEHVAVARHRLDLVRGLDEEQVRALALDHGGEPRDVLRRGAGRHEAEAVAHEPADGVRAHVDAVDVDLALAVRLELADEGARAGAAGCSQDDLEWGQGHADSVPDGAVRGARGSSGRPRTPRRTRSRC